MKKLMVLVAMLASQTVWADGFICQTEEGDLNVKIFNNVKPEEGTRNVSTMVISDPAVSHGRKTIARFSAEQGTLTGGLPVYKAKVDLRFADLRAKGENIAGTKLGHLAHVIVGLRYDYRQALPSGSEVTGWMTFQKRNGEEMHAQLICERYLKN